MPTTLEQGHITFLYEPAAGEEDAARLVDVYHFYAVMRPEGGGRARRLVLGHKALPPPDAQGGEARYWGFVDAVADDAHGLDAWREEGAGTPPPTPPKVAAEGAYALVRDGRDTRLAYRLTAPRDVDTHQEMFHLEPEGTFVLTIKNPEAGAPAGAGLAPDERATYPTDLAERFGGRRWVPADPPAFLDHEHAEFLLISTGDTAPGDRGP